MRSTTPNFTELFASSARVDCIVPGSITAGVENHAEYNSPDWFASARIQIEADVVEPFGDQIFISGIEDIRVIEQQNRRPVHQVPLRNQFEALAFQRIGDVFPGDD